MEQIYEIEPLLKAGACIQIHPQGYSMYPFIDPRRDEVVLAGIEDGSALRRGDVVLYRRENGMLVLHRIYKIGQDGLYLLGDHQTAIEGPVRREQGKGTTTGIGTADRYGKRRTLYGCGESGIPDVKCGVAMAQTGAQSYYGACRAAAAHGKIRTFQKKQ